jgi:hypothetical protein
LWWWLWWWLPPCASASAPATDRPTVFCASLPPPPSRRTQRRVVPLPHGALPSHHRSLTLPRLFIPSSRPSCRRIFPRWTARGPQSGALPRLPTAHRRNANGQCWVV